MDILEENKQGYEGKNRTLTRFIIFEEYKYLYGVVQYLHEDNRSRLLAVDISSPRMNNQQ